MFHTVPYYWEKAIPRPVHSSMKSREHRTSTPENHKQRIRTCTSGLLLQNRCRSSKIEHQKHDREFIKPKISLTDKSNQIAKESFQIKIFQIWIQIKAHKVSTLQPTMATCQNQNRHIKNSKTRESNSAKTNPS